MYLIYIPTYNICLGTYNNIKMPCLYIRRVWGARVRSRRRMHTTNIPAILSQRSRAIPFQAFSVRDFPAERASPLYRSTVSSWGLRGCIIIQYASMRGLGGGRRRWRRTWRAGWQYPTMDVPIKNGIPRARLRRHSFIIVAENAKGHAASDIILLLRILLYWIIHVFNDSWCDILLFYALESRAVRANATVERRLHFSVVRNYCSLNHVIHVHISTQISLPYILFPKESVRLLLPLTVDNSCCCCI